MGNDLSAGRAGGAFGTDLNTVEIHQLKQQWSVVVQATTGGRHTSTSAINYALDEDGFVQFVDLI